MEGGRATGDINNMEAASAAFSFAPAASRYLSRSVPPRPLVQALRNNVRVTSNVPDLLDWGVFGHENMWGQYSTALDARDAIII
jgi:hypothetical protein